MTAYYNEFDPKAAAWLRELIKAGHIAAGDVDERSIVDIRPSDLIGYTQCHFFAGIGVWSYALRRAGWPDDRPVWTGSCPCQPHSAAASERKLGFADPRDLWPSWFNLISQCQPDIVFGEQVDDSADWIDRMLADMEAARFAVGAIDLPACAAGAPHERMRTYFVANSYRARCREQSGAVAVAPKQFPAKCASGCTFWGDHRSTGELGRIRRVEPSIRLLAHGATARMGRLRGYGNAIVAPAAQAFIEAYLEVETVTADSPTAANDNTSKEMAA